MNKGNYIVFCRDPSFKVFQSGKNQKIYHSVINWLHDVAIRSFSKPLLLLLIVLLLLLIVTLLCIFLSPRFISVRGVFRTHSNIYDGAFCVNSWRLSAVDHFRKKLYLRCLTEFSMRLFQYYFFVLHLWQIWQLQKRIDQKWRYKKDKKSVDFEHE